jgi:uncharacterized protein (DUF1800 family)
LEVRGATGRRAASERDAPAIARLLRRTTFGPFPGQVATHVDAGHRVGDVVDALLGAPPLPFTPPHDIDVPLATTSPPELGSPVLQRWWVERMGSDDAGLHEKLMWFWHGHFTTSASKANYLLLWHQLRTIHEHAMGNFGSLAKAMVVDPAMLMWLDGADSKIVAPNENLGRELMELFTLGRGHYTEDDVRAAARSLSGWTIDFDRPAARFVAALGPSEPDLFLGRTTRWTTDSLVDHLLEQPATAPFVVGKLWRAFIGGPVDDELVDAWADAWRADGYELRPLIATMLTSEAIGSPSATRARSAMEWAIATVRALGVDPATVNVADLQALGQAPYDPPNVAGWPDGGTWVSPASTFARASFVARTSPQGVASGSTDDDAVAAVLEHCSLFDLSTATEAGLRALADRVGTDATGHRTLLQAAVLSPEFALA